MKWKQALESYEATKDWKTAVEYMAKVLPEHVDDPEAWIRTIYLIWHIILEENPENIGLNSTELEKQLLNYFNESYKKFSSNAEYLFFVGIIMVTGWYFNHPEDEFAIAMKRKAFELEPANILYEWGTLNEIYSKQECIRRVELAKQILDGSPQKKWLEEKGFPGQYVLKIQLDWSAQSLCTNEGVLTPHSTNVMEYRS